MRLRSLAALAAPLLLSCSENSTGMALLVTVSGHLTGPNAGSIPANARVQVPQGYQFPGLIGFSEDHSVIFARHLIGEIASDWPSDFPPGYSVGEVRRSTTTFDSFVRVGLDDLVIVVDDIENLDPPNWT